MAAQAKIEVSTLSAAMAKAFAEIEGAKKDGSNPHFQAKFASLGSVVDAIKPALAKHGLFFTQASHVAEDGVCVETVIHHASGESLSCGKLYVPANKRDAQGFGSALTYARRYGLMTAFGVPAEDDDGNAAARSYVDEPDHIHVKKPAAREVLDGPHTSKTALREAVNDLITAVRKAETLEAVDMLKAAHKRTINQALRDWPSLIDGDPNIGEDIGLKGAIELRRQELTVSDEAQMCLETLEQCTSSQELNGWFKLNWQYVEELDGAERDRVEARYQELETGLKAVDTVAGG